MTDQPDKIESKPFKIDACYITEDELSVFASRMEHVTPDFQEWMESCMNNKGSKEFYKGLMAGYAATYALLHQVPVSEITDSIQGITAFLAAKVRKMPSIDLPRDMK